MPTSVSVKVIRDGVAEVKGPVHWKVYGEVNMMSNSCPAAVSIIDVHQLASVVKNRIENVLIIDCRSFIEYNTCHVSTAVNVCCSKIVKRRLQQEKLSVKEFLVHTCHCDVDSTFDIVVYDQQSKDLSSMPSDSFTAILLKKLQHAFRSVNLLSGGLTAFQESYSELCGDKVRKVPPPTSLSQPCLPIADQGPTRILPFLYLGSQFDAVNRDLLRDHNITYELNVSTTFPKPDFLPEGHFLRVPVNDNYSEKLLPYFSEAFRFVDKAREGNACVLIHCLAGISRSPTIAIGYVMRYLRLSSDDGYRYVKSKRPTISPNFNFLGQLLEFEKQLRKDKILLDSSSESEHCSPLTGGKKRLCKTDMRTAKLSLNIKTDMGPNVFSQASRTGEQSPTTALAKLSFSGPPTPEVVPPPEGLRHSRSYESMLEITGIHTTSATCTNVSVLSPVKEIKCESLISEISTGQGNSNGRTSSNQWKYTRSSSREKRASVASTYHVSETSKLFSSSACPSSQAEVTSESWKKPGKRETRFPFSFSENRADITSTETASFMDKISDRSKVSTRTYFEPTPPNALSTSSSRSSYRRSDSTATSGFGSESSDWYEENQTGKPTERSKMEFDLDDLEDDVIVRSSADRESGSAALFPLTLLPTRGECVEWPKNLQSPVSPSESHLLEDVISQTSSGFCQPSGSTSTSISDLPFSEGSENLQDSGMSSRWSLSRKRVATFDDQVPSTPASCREDVFSRDKRKYKPLGDLAANTRQSRTENSGQTLTQGLGVTSKEMSFPEFATSVKSDFCDSSFCLYRVQSCPGISGQERLDSSSSFSYVESETFRRTSFRESSIEGRLNCHAIRKDGDRTTRKDVLCVSESCPETLHLSGPMAAVRSVPSSPHHRDFRKNVRLIRVS